MDETEDPPDPAWAEFRRELGGRLRRAREAAGLTQAGLAGLAGVSRTTVQRTEGAYGEVPGLAAVWSLARACGLRPEDLLAVGSSGLRRRRRRPVVPPVRQQDRPARDGT